MTRHGDAGDALPDAMHHSLDDAATRFMSHLLTRSMTHLLTRCSDAGDALPHSPALARSPLEFSTARPLGAESSPVRLMVKA